MQSLWNDSLADQCADELSLRVYSSRLLGSDPCLVLHGGGNTSVKLRQPDLFGEEETILYVKGSGWDLSSIEAEGFTPLRMDHLLKLATLDQLTDMEMVNQLKTHQTIASAPTASVEAILHAVLPYKYVDHTHADALIAISNTPQGEARIRQIYGNDLVIIPYVMPGFDLAREVAERFPKEAHSGTIGMVLMNHGLFSFGGTAKESYERMILLVDRAEQYLKSQDAWDLPVADSPPIRINAAAIPAFRRELSATVGKAVILRCHRDPSSMGFCQQENLSTLAGQGPATPDHVIRTKRLPLLGQDLSGYTEAYRNYFETNAPLARNPVQMLDPAPRVILDPKLGMLTLGRSARDAGIVADIYRHTLKIIQQADRLGGWQALPEKDIFDVEYWELEQAKLRQPGKALSFQGEVALITGAASGIGKACAEAMLKRGAAVVGLDLNPEIETRFASPEYLGICCDITDPQALNHALEAMHPQLRRTRYADSECRNLSRRLSAFRALRQHMEKRHAGQSGRQSASVAGILSTAQTGPEQRPGGGYRIEECTRPRHRRRGLFSLQGGP